jgi:carboxylate-amine ligase
MAIPFKASPRPTLGVEEEYQLCDPVTGDLVPRVEYVMEQADEALRERLSYDLILGLVEANTEVSETVGEAVANLLDKRRKLLAIAERGGFTLGLTGTHPYADPMKTQFVETPAYRWVHDQLGYVAQRNITFGLHVHVGVDDADRAVYVANRMRKWIGPLIALAANSPYIDGVDTRWNSARMYAFGAFPRAGLPPRLDDYAAFSDEMDALIAAGAITQPRQIWWNVRVHPPYGTVEFRACDVQISLARTAAIIALVQALIVAYGDAHRAGEPEPYQHGTYLEDLRWKGMRFGLEADVIDPITGKVMPMAAYVDKMLEAARPAAERLGTSAYLETFDGILRDGNEATAQRKLYEEVGGDLVALQLRLLERAAEAGIRNPETVSV